MSEQIDAQDEINLLDYWRVLVKHKKLIGSIVGLAFVGSIIVSFLLPKIYAATASILPAQQQGGPSLISQLPAGAGSLAAGFLSMTSPTEVWMGILKSNSIKDAIIDRFDLMKIFEVENRDEARNILGGMLNIRKTREEIISVTIEDQDPQRAADLANAYVEELDRINKGILMTSGKRMRVFVEQRLIEAKEELTQAEEAVKLFQEKNRTVKLDDQSRAIIEAIGAVKAEVMAKEVALYTMMSYATPDHPQVQLLRTEINELEENMRELLEGKKHPGNPSPEDIFIPTTKIPDLAFQYAQLLRAAKMHETLYGLLVQQFEMARIQEAKDTPTVQILDEATAPVKKTKPKRRAIVILFTIMGGFIALFAAFFSEYVGRMRSLEKQSSASLARKDR